ncbi:MAG: OsmC family protein [Bacteroidota bacterium]
MSMDPHYYEVNITWSRDRRGMICAPDISTQPANGGCLEVATPPQFSGGIPGIWSPEHLFTASVSSCLMTTFLAIAENSGLDFSSFQCASKGKLERLDRKFLMTEIILEPTITIAHSEDRERAWRILEKSEAACLISNSVKSKVTMNATVNIL